MIGSFNSSDKNQRCEEAPFTHTRHIDINGRKSCTRAAQSLFIIICWLFSSDKLTSLQIHYAAMRNLVLCHFDRTGKIERAVNTRGWQQGEWEEAAAAFSCLVRLNYSSFASYAAQLAQSTQISTDSPRTTINALLASLYTVPRLRYQ